MKQRNLFGMFILTGMFHGIYLFVWLYSVQTDMAYRYNKSKMSGGLTILLIIVTLGIYGLVWQWNFCKQLKSLGKPDKSISTLILSILLIGIIINPLLIQSSINCPSPLSFDF